MGGVVKMVAMDDGVLVCSGRGAGGLLAGEKMSDTGTWLIVMLLVLRLYVILATK